MQRLDGDVDFHGRAARESPSTRAVFWKSIAQQRMNGSQIFTSSIGRSVEGREIVIHSNFDPAASPTPPGLTLLIGGQHGDEPATNRLLADFLESPAWSRFDGCAVMVLPLVNPDGFERGTRYNARGVDLNRNCGFNWHADSEEPPGREPWSEPETCALRDLILSRRPTKIVSLHWALSELDADGAQSTALAHAMWNALTPEQSAPYRLRLSELGHGQRHLLHRYSDCPGSLGQWCGYDVAYPGGVLPSIITLELPYDPFAPHRPAELHDGHLDEVRALWQRDAEGYLRAVGPGVHAMLTAACWFGH
jgi:protein MpaA